MNTDNRLYRFTNASGRTNHGLVTEFTTNGVYAIFDAFDIAERVTLPARYAFVSLTPNPYLVNHNAVTELLPLTADVKWHDERVAKVAALMLRGEFDAWWQANKATVTATLYKKYED